MAKIRDPRQFSAHFGIQADKIAQLGVLDPTLMETVLDIA